MKRSLFSLAIVAASLTQAAHAQAPLLLGTVNLAETQDSDTVLLAPCPGPTHNRRVDFVKIEVSRFPAEIDSVTLTYFNGQTESLMIREYFAVGTSSRWVNLAGNDRCIRKITVRGDAETAGYHPLRQSQVQIWGY